MSQFVNTIRRMFCKHSFSVLHTYDRDTHKVYCAKCKSKYVINNHYGWKFYLSVQGEKDYDELQEQISNFQKDYLNNKEFKGEDH